jgi:threonine dehydratase
MSFGIDDIRRARETIAGKIVETPLLESPFLNRMLNCRLFVKAENLQVTGAFKFRGALNKISSLPDEQRKKGILAFSSGNHGHAVAAAANQIGCPAVIVLPNTTAAIKVENCRWWGAETIFYDATTVDRETFAKEVADSRGLTVVPPFDDELVMAGQGTVGLEIHEQLKAVNVTPDLLVSNCSGGGLSSGVTEAFKHFYPSADVVLVEPAGGEKMSRSLESGMPERNFNLGPTILDGINGPVAGTKTLEVLRRHGVSCTSINEDEALAGMFAAFKFLKLVIEPGGAASLAAILAKKIDVVGKTVVILASGGNVDPAVFTRALQLGEK